MVTPLCRGNSGSVNWPARAPCSSVEAALERAWLSEVRLAGILASPSGRFRMSRHLVNIVYRIDGQSIEIGQNRLP
jgi:hypothetical protein